MVDRELRKLKREELLWILIDVTVENEELKKQLQENEKQGEEVTKSI